MSAPEGSTVTFHRSSANLRPLALARFARKLQKDVAHGRPFDCRITGDAELRRLNREFRGKDYATDVLSFPASCGAGTLAADGHKRRDEPRGGRQERPRHIGDIAISAARAQVQARQYGHSVETEIRILMLHGVLHLMGYDHEIDGGRMARAEARWRARLRLPHGLIERVRP